MSDKLLFNYDAKEGEILIFTVAMGDFYELRVFTKKEDALTDLWNCFKCSYAVLFCSDEEIYNEHLEEIKQEECSLA
jgi:Pyruvate/2-oxoacid:ferredoxin oxidoreductase delta subunit